MRKLISQSLFLLVIWQIVGFVAYFDVSHYTLKKEIKSLLKRGIPEGELITYTFNQKELNQLKWLKKNEFEFKGNLYDVVSTEKLPGSKWKLACISDKQETLLFATLSQNVASNLGDSKHPTPLFNLMKILHFPLIANDFLVQFSHTYKIDNHRHIFIYLPHESMKSVRIDTPPPCFIS